MTVNREMAMIHELARLSAALGIAKAENHIVHAEFQSEQQIQTGQTALMLRNTESPAELVFQDTVDAASLLLSAQLASVI